VLLTPNLGISEEYNDNIFFTPDKTWDLVTRLRIGMGVTYVTENSDTNLNLGTSMVYLARSANTAVNLAEAQRLNLSTAYQWTPYLRFDVDNSLARVGTTRDIGFVTGADTSLPPPQQETDPSDINPGNVSITLPRGSAFVNSFGITATYFFDPRWSSSFNYGNGVANFDDPGDVDLTQRAGITLGYQLTPTLSVGPAVSYSRFNSTNAQDSEAYGLGLGANYQVSDLWNVFGSLGGALTRQLEGPSETNGSVTFAIGLNRSFERSGLTIGAQQGITPSAGVAGSSTTLTGYVSYGIQLTQLLSGSLTASYSHFDTTSGSFELIGLNTGVSYVVWRNITARLAYVYRRSDAGEPFSNELSEGIIDQNAVRIQFGWAQPWWQFDLW